ncbi:DUF1329 domain-containing protein [Motiliproteus sp. MSK22-1]|uniref:DUF1329 domain-containing protein n=1 Tax=Motiliproteus sp. MSK22-1 TaxID=1897630 RepID=UPI000977E206|nr:DUF1329 domain-containing protein [Motiliproteus sp. MSK22-1]OMH28364.1 outer membrane lipoprotein-sorting protein [Motiliproteus sp. MSK22-1]
MINKKNIVSKKNFLAVSALALALQATVLQAAVSADDASQLGASLTPIGALKAGNAEGTIPAWSGQPDEFSGDRYQNPYADEQVLFTITAANAEQYSGKLTDGQMALLKKYPDSYKINVYPTHRTGAFPQHVYDVAKKNATQTTVVENGNGLLNFEETIPFPIPKTGVEAIWNHITRYRGGSLERTLVQVPVHRNGSYTPVRFKERLVWPQYLEDGFDVKKDDNILNYFTQQVLAPTRLTGNVLLIHETLDQVKQPRKAWQYNAGQRRVRRAPQVAYDAPGTAADGLRTADNLDMYNGAPNRYDWKLVGKQELYIPYNSFKLASRDLQYSDILKPGHLNPDLLRYELHRVWVVEATLKEGERHIYAKRRFYIDEDSWQASVVDHYDARGELWRVGEAHAFQYRDAKVPWHVGEVLHDLLSGRYLAGSLTNEEAEGFNFGVSLSRKEFTTSAIRRSGKR